LNCVLSKKFFYWFSNTFFIFVSLQYIEIPEVKGYYKSMLQNGSGISMYCNDTKMMYEDVCIWGILLSMVMWAEIAMT
jgi:hypothetical protein